VLRPPGLPAVKTSTRTNPFSERTHTRRLRLRSPPPLCPGRKESTGQGATLGLFVYRIERDWEKLNTIQIKILLNPLVPAHMINRGVRPAHLTPSHVTTVRSAFDGVLMSTSARTLPAREGKSTRAVRSPDTTRRPPISRGGKPPCRLLSSHPTAGAPSSATALWQCSASTAIIGRGHACYPPSLSPSSFPCLSLSRTHTQPAGGPLIVVR
jgi:hypothetical protein